MKASALAHVSVFALAACQPIDPFTAPANPICEEQVTELDGPESLTPSGLRAADFLERVTGPRAATLDYLPPPTDDGVFVEIDISEPSSALTLELSPVLASLRWIEAELIYPEGADTSVEIVCDSGFEFEAELALSSADGVFAEQFETTARAIVDAQGELDLLAVPLSYEPDALAGSFEILSISPSSPPPSYVFHELWVEYPLAEGAQDSTVEPRGYVGGVAEYDLIEYYLIGVFHIGVFGGYTL